MIFGMDVGATHDPGKLGRAAAGLPVVPVFDGYRALAILGIVAMHIILICGVVPAAVGNDRVDQSPMNMGHSSPFARQTVDFNK